MSQTTYYKAAKEANGATPAQPAKSVVVNDAPDSRGLKDGSDAIMSADGWSKEKPEGWEEPVDPKTLQQRLDDALAENDQLRSQDEGAAKKGAAKK